jgi:hypothetical protein
MKKFLILALALLMALALVACGDKGANANEPPIEEPIAEESIEEEPVAETKATDEPKQKASSSALNPNDISYSEELKLTMIMEDLCQKVAANPSTVNIHAMSYKYTQNGHNYHCYVEFDCANKLGVTETHVLNVDMMANDDYSKIQPVSGSLDGQSLNFV